MSPRKCVAILRFDGPRFQDHGLDVDVLPELIAYKVLLQETAKDIWRRKHPDRIRLPKNFDAGINLKFFELEPGSTAVPLVREWRSGQLPFDDELDEAAHLLQQAIQAAERGQSAPAHLSRSVIPYFDSLGRTLRNDECLLVSLQYGEGQARYDQSVKQRILAWGTTAYPDAVDLIGEVRATDLDGLKFTLRLSDGRKVTGKFRPDHERTILEALGEHVSRRIHVRGTGQFTPEDGNLRQIVNVEWIEVIGSEPPARQSIPIWERLALIGADTETEAWNSVPADLSENLDRYLYGRKDPH